MEGKEEKEEKRAGMRVAVFFAEVALSYEAEYLCLKVALGHWVSQGLVDMLV